MDDINASLPLRLQKEPGACANLPLRLQKTYKLSAESQQDVLRHALRHRRAWPQHTKNGWAEPACLASPSRSQLER
ncbi:hypothetical protein BHAP_0118 [Bifidobacterium hapali]|uniref:Uncharacterized protein n=1 Tax=Bifidobacterium hapali TaxID=1630172 RepID=A0A261G582_9BIFI|nr:hypothetical protein BHAP_0118 [Bifidobacterium hapali]